MPRQSADRHVQPEGSGASDPLWVALGGLLALCVGIIGGLVIASTGVGLASAILAGGGCFAAALTLYLLVLGALRSSRR